HVIVLFGATGDLAKRKLIPGLYHLAAAGLLPKRYRIIGTSPAQFAITAVQFRKHAKDSIREFGIVKPTGETWKTFEASLDFGSSDPANPKPLLDAVAKARAAIGGAPRLLHHLAIPPVAFGSVITMLGASGLNQDAHVIIEKPFGYDLESARALNDTIHKVFDESCIFRIDHFLGKEAIDNILALRFANGMFEPIWNRNHVSYVQIDVPETLSIEGRAAFYDATGAYRDMVVTHLLQVLGFVAMEPPSSLTAKALRDEKSKVFDSMPEIDPADVVRGQYKGYRNEEGVSKRSQTETFVALKAAVENWRWHGVPFYLRTGKSLAENRQVITLGFRGPALKMFPIDLVETHGSRRNELVIDFKDPGSISASFLTKEPGPVMQLAEVAMQFRYTDSWAASNNLEGYERLILNAMLGDQALFTRSDGVERLWEISTPLLENPPPVEAYAPGSWGPESVNTLVAPYRWRLPE
ncbi:MAG TPA: glucose-6-phosphate dehydrogenase, partial [Acidimicrobiales bacterium]|nr:glucose-6-phosphate dehydrogenase [Acidimicrobiales bacterium]